MLKFTELNTVERPIVEQWYCNIIKMLNVKCENKL